MCSVPESLRLARMVRSVGKEPRLILYSMLWLILAYTYLRSYHLGSPASLSFFLFFSNRIRDSCRFRAQTVCTYLYDGVHIFLIYDSLCLSVRLSVCLSVCTTYFSYSPNCNGNARCYVNPAGSALERNESAIAARFTLDNRVDTLAV